MGRAVVRRVRRQVDLRPFDDEVIRWHLGWAKAAASCKLRSMDIVVPSSVAAGGSGVRGPRAAQKQSFSSRLFGYDVFISFALGGPPRGTQGYASDLARRLRERDLSVFFSEDEAPPGSPLSDTLVRALVRSRVLVVIVNHGTLAQPRWVRTEVETYAERCRGRPIIPVSLDDGLRNPELSNQAQNWLRHQQHIWVDESPDAAGTGLASDAVVDRLATAPRRLRSNALWRWLVRAVVIGLAALAAGLWLAMQAAQESDRKARSELTRAVALGLVSRSQGRLASTGNGHDDTRALLEAVAAQRLVEGGPPVKDVLDGLWNALEAKQDLLATIRLTAPGDGLRHPDDERVSDIAWSPDGSRWLVAEGSALRLRRAGDGAPLGSPLALDSGPVQWRRLAFAPDGRSLLLLDDRGRLRLWDSRSGKLLDLLPEARHRTVDAAFAPDGGRVWVAFNDAEPGLQTLPLPRAEGALSGRVVAGSPNFISRIAVDRQGARIAIGAGRIVIWDARAGRPAGAPIKAFEEEDVGAIAWSPDGRVIAAGGGGRYRDGVREAVRSEVGLWDAASGRPLGPLRSGHTAQVRSLLAAPDGSRFWSASLDGTVRAWSSSDGSPLGPVLRGHAGPVLAIALAPDGRRLVSAGDDGTLRLWQVEGATPLARKAAPAPQAVEAVAEPASQPVLRGLSSESAVAQHGSLLRANCDAEGLLTVQDLASKRVLWTARTGAIAALSFIDDARLLAAVFPDGRQQRWHSSDGTVQRTPPQLEAMPPPQPCVFWQLRMSGDGRRVAAWSSSVVQPTTWIWWDADSGRVLLRRELAAEDISELRFAPNGQVVLVVGSLRGGRSGLPEWTLRFVRAADAAALGGAVARSEPVPIDFTDDGHAVRWSGPDGKAWSLPAPSAWADVVCSKLSRNMSPAQWRDWVSPEINYLVQCPGLPVPD
jgi:WD40 repeat protein